MRVSKARASLRRAASFLLLGCASLPANLFAAESGDVEQSVRATIEKHCGSCHDGAVATAKPGALKVFDLREENWTRRMSREQLKKVNGRVSGVELPDEQKKQIADFIQAKLRERSRSER